MARGEGWRTNPDRPVPEARRIVSMAPGNTGILHAPGVGRRVVGVDRWSDDPPRVRSLPMLEGDLHVDVQKVAALRLDLAVASLPVPGMEESRPQLEAASLRYVAAGGVGPGEVWQDRRVVGRSLGRSARAEALVEQTGGRMERLRRLHGDLAGRPRVHGEWSARPVVADRRSWVTELIRLAGGENAVADLDVESARVAMQQAIARRPEGVAASWCGACRLLTVHRIGSRPGWEAVLAMRSGQVLVFAEDLVGRPEPRLADGLERLARVLHPEVRA